MSAPLTLADEVQASPDAVTADLGAEAVVLELGRGRYYGMPGPAASIWRALQAPARLADVAEALLREYDVDGDRCRRELLELVDALEDRGLVRRLGPAA